VNVLLCGASGAIGRAVRRALLARGHRVVAASRGAASTATSMPVDFERTRRPEAWAEALRARGIDAVVNAAGILIEGRGASFARVHRDGPLELFAGARLAGVRRVVQVSAAGGVPSAYLRSKHAADAALLGDGALDGAVLRPTLVFGPGCVSGRLFATLAALPVVALPGGGRQRLQPVHVLEVAEVVAALLERRDPVRGVHAVAGGTEVTYVGMLEAYRRAQGLRGDALRVPVPMALLRASAVLAERLPQRVLSRDTVAMLEAGSTAPRNDAPALLGRAPTGLAEGLPVTPPAPWLDLRVALPPAVEAVLRVAVAALWLHTALVSALLPEASGVLDLLARCGFAGDAGRAALAFSCALNTAIGVATLLRPAAIVYAVQLVAIAGYTLTAAWHWPQLTIDHCAPLAKNLPLAAAVLVLWLGSATRGDDWRSAPARAAPGAARPRYFA
jgi:uncharacterized protein YbjT (DUF2867 family)